MADKKGKTGSPDDIMAPAAMRPILAVAKGGVPASCAIGLTKDKDGVILLDRRKKPKALLADLKKQATGAGLELEMPTLRFGHAKVDTEQDAGLLTLVVNKDAGGAMRSKMLERVKKAGFAKVEIIVDPSLENEPEEDHPAPPMEAGAEPPPSLPAQAPQPAPPDFDVPAQAQAAAAPVPSPPASPPPTQPTPPPGQDAAGLTKMLTDLVRQMLPVIGADPTRGNELKGLAAQAQASLKSGNFAAAAAGINTLRDALNRPTTPAAAPAGQAPGNGAGPASPGPSPAIAKARLAWVTTRQKVEGDLGKLHGAFTSAFKGHGKEADLTQAFRTRVDTVLGTLDEALAHKLDAVNGATDPAQRAKLVQEAHATIQNYSKHVASDPTIAALDKNPFVPLSIQKTMTATLAALSKAIS